MGFIDKTQRQKPASRRGAEKTTNSFPLSGVKPKNPFNRKLKPVFRTLVRRNAGFVFLCASASLRDEPVLTFFISLHENIAPTA
jgi:hypothetical protein